MSAFPWLWVSVFVALVVFSMAAFGCAVLFERWRYERARLRVAPPGAPYRDYPLPPEPPRGYGKKRIALFAAIAILVASAVTWGAPVYLSFFPGDQGTFAPLGTSTVTLDAQSPHVATATEYAGFDLNVKSLTTFSAPGYVFLPCVQGELKVVSNLTDGGQTMNVGCSLDALDAAGTTVPVQNGAANSTIVVSPDGVNYVSAGGGAGFDAAPYLQTGTTIQITGAQNDGGWTSVGPIFDTAYVTDGGIPLNVWTSIDGLGGGPSEHIAVTDMVVCVDFSYLGGNATSGNFQRLVLVFDANRSVDGGQSLTTPGQTTVAGMQPLGGGGIFSTSGCNGGYGPSDAGCYVNGANGQLSYQVVTCSGGGCAPYGDAGTGFLVQVTTDAGADICGIKVEHFHVRHP